MNKWYHNFFLRLSDAKRQMNSLRLRNRWRKDASVAMPAGKKVILTFHGVVAEKKRPDINTKFITAAVFEQQVLYMRKHFHMISLDEYFSNRLDPDRLNVAIAFDDGYRNQHRFACPVLADLGIPAAFFVCAALMPSIPVLWTDLCDAVAGFLPPHTRICGRRTGYRRGRLTDEESETLLIRYAAAAGGGYIHELIQTLFPFFIAGCNRETLQRLEIMTGAEIAETARNPLFTIGSHGHLHLDYAHVADEAVLRDMQLSAVRLSNICRCEIRYLALPFGSYNDKTIRLAIDSGYDHILRGDLNKMNASDEFCYADRVTFNPYLRPCNHADFLIRETC